VFLCTIDSALNSFVAACLACEEVLGRVVAASRTLPSCRQVRAPGRGPFGWYGTCSADGLEAPYKARRSTDALVFVD